MDTISRAEQPRNAFFFFFYKPFGRVTLESDVQFQNASVPILVTFFGILMLFKEVHPEKARPHMSVKLLGSVMVCKDVHPSNAHDFIVDTPSLMEISFSELQSQKADAIMVFIVPGIDTVVRSYEKRSPNSGNSVTPS